MFRFRRRQAALVGLLDLLFQMGDAPLQAGKIIVLALLQPDFAGRQVVKDRLELLALLQPQLFTHTPPPGVSVVYQPFTET